MIYVILIGVVGMLFAAYSHAIKKQAKAEAQHEIAQEEKHVMANEADIDRRIIADADVLDLLRRKADQARKHESKGKQ